MKNDKLAYAAAFCSYLIERSENIRSIILFGSVARDESDKNSDIDIFVDTVYPKSVQSSKIVNGFYKSQAFRTWALKGIKNRISVLAGNINSNEWTNLKRSIITDGIVLFGKYKSRPEKLRHFMLFSYNNIKDPKKRVNLHRKLFGYKLGSKQYDGIVTKTRGMRHGSGSFSVPVEHYREVQGIFRQMKITPRIIEIWVE